MVKRCPIKMQESLLQRFVVGKETYLSWFYCLLFYCICFKLSHQIKKSQNRTYSHFKQEKKYIHFVA